MSDDPIIIRVAPAQETLSPSFVNQYISPIRNLSSATNRFTPGEPQATIMEHDEFDITIGNQEEREQFEDTDSITGKIDVLLLFRFHILIIYSYFHLRIYQNQHPVYL